MTTVKALQWIQTTRLGDRWTGASALGRVYIVTRGEGGWICGIEGEGWKRSEKTLEEAKAHCQGDWAADVLAEIEQ